MAVQLLPPETGYVLKTQELYIGTVLDIVNNSYLELNFDSIQNFYPVERYIASPEKKSIGFVMYHDKIIDDENLKHKMIEIENDFDRIIHPRYRNRKGVGNWYHNDFKCKDSVEFRHFCEKFNIPYYRNKNEDEGNDDEIEGVDEEEKEEEEEEETFTYDTGYYNGPFEGMFLLVTSDPDIFKCDFEIHEIDNIVYIFRDGRITGFVYKLNSDDHRLGILAGDQHCYMLTKDNTLIFGHYDKFYPEIDEDKYLGD